MWPGSGALLVAAARSHAQKRNRSSASPEASAARARDSKVWSCVSSFSRPNADPMLTLLTRCQALSGHDLAGLPFRMSRLGPWGWGPA